ncbi:MAG: restriction endonuclease subunit S [Armatimonadetes bacterium]|nr:restriction endonuclease subunit S [Armatimonadota bacterium]
MGELFAYDRIAGQQMERVQLNERELRLATLRRGDLLFARSSLKAEGTGKCSIVQSVPEVTTFESHLIRVRLDGKKADPWFYFYFFRSYVGRARVLSIAKQVGAAGLPGSNLARLTVPRPQMETQARIAGILSAYDDLIDNNRRRMALLEEAARQLYREWFVRLRFPAHEHTKTNCGMPEGWESVPLGELCTDIRESVDPRDVPSTTPYIGLEHMPRRSITLGEWGYSDEVASSKFWYHDGDILFGRIRPYFHKVGFAPVEGVTSSDTIVIRPVEKQLYHYLLLLLSSDEFVAVASKTVREGSKMPRADWAFLETVKFMRPPPHLLRKVTDLIGPTCSQLRVLALETRKLADARDLLLPRLMDGGTGA